MNDVDSFPPSLTSSSPFVIPSFIFVQLELFHIYTPSARFPYDPSLPIINLEVLSVPFIVPVTDPLTSTVSPAGIVYPPYISTVDSFVESVIAFFTSL